VRAAVIFFTVGTRRLIKRAGEDAGKGLLRVKAVFQANIVDPLIGIAQIAGRQQQLTLADIAPQTLPLYCKNSRCKCHFE
jgi:membrane protease subunit (stomatin/prohibitin family)